MCQDICKRRTLQISSFYNTEINFYSVLRVEKSNLIPVNETDDNIIKFYKPSCNNEYQMHISHTSTHKLIQFIGKNPNVLFAS